MLVVVAVDHDDDINNSINNLLNSYITTNIERFFIFWFNSEKVDLLFYLI